MSNPVLTFTKGEINKAIELAAKENYERDVSVMGEEDTGHWAEVKNVYLKEAEYLLENTGKNWEPELPHHHCITIEG